MFLLVHVLLALKLSPVSWVVLYVLSRQGQHGGLWIWTCWVSPLATVKVSRWPLTVNDAVLVDLQAMTTALPLYQRPSLDDLRLKLGSTHNLVLLRPFQSNRFVVPTTVSLAVYHTRPYNLHTALFTINSRQYKLNYIQSLEKYTVLAD